MTGFPGLRMDRRCWRMTSAAADLRHPEPKKWLKKCDNWFTVIEEWPSWSWNKKLASLTDPFTRFCPTIWRWDMSVRSLFWGSWPRIRWNFAWWSLEICLRKVGRTQRFSQRSSLVMSHGCSPTTRRWSCSHQNGTQRHLADQRNHASSNPRKKWCSLHFLTSTVWCTMSLYCLDRLLMVISMCKFCRGCAIQFGGNGTTSGRESGFYIMIMLRATHCLLCSNSSLRKAFLSSPNHRTLPDLAPSDFWLFPTLKMGVKGMYFSTMEHIKSNAMTKLRRIPKEAFHWCFQ